MIVNLELYRIFLVVAETGNITKASEKLNISQPAVTKHIKNLEDNLGNSLFIRTKKGVLLNEYGKAIFLKVKQALTLIEEAEQEIGAYKNFHKGTIKIGISTTLTKRYLFHFLEQFHKEYSNIIIDIYTDPTKELIKKLKEGMLDFIIGKFPYTKDLDLEYQTLGTTKYIFAYNPKYYEITKPISVMELNQYPLLLQETPSNSRDSIERFLKENRIHIEPTMNIASSNLLIDFIIMGYGIGYVTKLYIEKELKTGILKELKITSNTESISYGIMSLKHNIMTSHSKKLIEYLKKRRKSNDYC